MDFLENLGKRVGEAAQAVAKKSGGLVEITKLTVNINSEEDRIQKLYTQIGKSIFEKYSVSGVTEHEAREFCETIKLHEQNIKALRVKIAEIKGTKQCVGCGTDMEKTQMFCSKCGAKNEADPIITTEEPAQQAQTVICPACGTALASGSAFCTSCGMKLG